MKMMFLLFFIILSLPTYAQFQEGYAPSKGTKIYYRVFGKGEPILIINGGPGGTSEGFAYLAGILGEKYQAITFDQRGVGKSMVARRDSTTINMDLMREDIEALRKHLGIEKWVVFGQSFGGILGSYYASKYPSRVKGIIYSASGGLDMEFMQYIQKRIQMNLTPLERDSLAYYNTKLASGDTTYNTRRKRAEFLAPAYIINKKHVPTIAERLMQVDMYVNSIVVNDLQKIRYDCKNKLKNFKKPVLILQGRQDIIAPEIAEKAVKILPNARLVMLDNCSHYGWLDAKDVYLQEIHDFMLKI